ncbi:hypothetical protein NQ314_007532 [Rhamnusium bicolor]|uniref:Titin n=1 Tax=Rhamnusium bicolor TaxID=1586634 RepID=A0AAV8YM60_9CUCU|nr:hypothetical protein NQ314_007532 [Rhamnusium bicolor]
MEEISIKPGTPKEIPTSEDEEKNYKIKQKDLPELPPESLKLKPFKKPDIEKDVKTVGESIGRPDTLGTQIYELPEEIIELQDMPPDGKPTRKTIKKRVIKKKCGPLQEITTIETTTPEEGEATVTIKVEKIISEEVEPTEGLDIIELPEVTEIIEEKVHDVEAEKDQVKTKKIKKRVLKKNLDGKQEITEIVTIEEEDKIPQIAVNIYITQLEDIDDESIIPTDFTTKITAITPKITPHTATKTITEVHTLEHTQDTSTGSLVPEMIKAKGSVVHDIKESIIVQAVQTQKPIDEVPEKPIYIEELPEEMQVIETVSEEGLPTKKFIKKRVIKKRKGDKLERTEILTVEEEGERPKSTVVVEEILLPEEALGEVPAVVPEQSTYIQELPEEVTVTQVETKEGHKKQIIKRRVPVSTVEIVELPETVLEELPAVKPDQTQFIGEYPEEVTELQTEEGSKKVIKRRVIKKRKGSKQEATEIITVEEEGKAPQSTVTIEEIELEKDILKELPVVKPEQTTFIEELPEEVTVTEVKTAEGTKKQVIKRRVIKKRKGSKQESTEIVTIEEDGKKPQSTVTIEETELPKEVLKELLVMQPEQTVFIEELPEEVTVTKVQTNEGPKKQIIKRRVIKKRKGSKQESTEIVTVEEEGKKPQSTVTIEETELPEEVVELPAVKPEETTFIEELPEEITVTEVKTEEGPKKQVIKRRVIKKRKGSKQESTEIVTVEEEGKKPQSTVTIEETEIPEEITNELYTAKQEQTTFIDELPEEITVTEVQTKEGPKKQVIKRRVIKKRKGDKQESTEIVTVEEEGKEPQSTVTIEETELPEEVIEELPVIKSEQRTFIEELPEEITVTEVKTEEGPKKQVIKRRVIKKRKGNKQESTEIVTVEEEGKKPQSTVTIEETELPEEVLKELPAIKPKHTAVIEELPEEVTITEVKTKEGPRKQIIKKRVIRKRKGSKEENTEIITVEEEGKLPKTTVVTNEKELSEDEKTTLIKKSKKPKIKPEEQALITEDNILFVPTLAEKKPSESDDIINLVKKELIKKALYQPVPEITQEVIVELPTVKPDETIVIEELPVEITVTEVKTEEGPKKQVIKRRVIKKRKGSKQESTEIITVEEEGKKPQSTVTIEETELPEEVIKELPVVKPEQTTFVEELPEEITVIEVKTEEGPKKQVIKRRVIKKRKGSKQESTEIVTVEEEGKKPQSTVTIEETELPEEILNELPVVKPEETTFIEELPEEITVTEVKTEEGPKKQVIKRRVIKKRKGSKQESTEIVTVEEEGKKPQSTVTIEETELPEENLKELPVVKPEETTVIEELPEEITVTEVKTEEGTKKQVIKRRVIKKRKGSKQESTEIVTVEEEGKKPQSTVTIEETELPEEILKELPVVKAEETTVIEELPEEITVTEVKTEQGPKKQVIKRRVIKKRKGSKQESTEIVTVEEEGKKPESTVTIEETELPEEILKELPVVKPEQTTFIEELPEEITVTEVKTEEGPKKQVIKRRVIKKRKGSKQESTEIVTVEEEGKKPQSTVTIEETELPEEILKELPVVKPEETNVIEELPEEITVTEVKTEQGPKKQVIKRRVIKKRKGSKQESTEIVTVEEEGKKPESTVTIEETELPEEILKELPVVKPEQTTFIEELPEEITVTEVKTEEGPKKQVIKRRVIKTRKGSKQESTEIVTVEEEGKKPQSTVTVEETELSEEVVKELPVVTPEQTTFVEELPEEITVIEIKTEEGPKKQVIKRRVIKKRKGSKQESTEIVTVEEEGKKPQSTVTVEETELSEEVIKELPVVKPEKTTFVEELPEEITVTEVKTEEGPKKQVIKRRVIKKRKGSKQESTEIVTVEEEGKKPQSTVTIEETELPEEILKELPVVKPEQTTFIEELPEEITVTEVKTEEGPRKQVIKKRVIKKRKGSKQESTEIVTVEEEGKKPQSTVTIEETELPTEIIEELPTVKPQETTVVEEFPEEITVTEVKTEEGPKKQVIKRRVIKKRKGSKQESTEIVTVEEEGKKPQSTVTIEETELPEEVIKELPVVKPEQSIFVEELPEEITVTEVKTEEGPKKQVIKRRVIKKRKGGKEESTEIVTVEEEGKKPQSTVTIEETELPEENLKEFPVIKPEETTVIEELPEEITVTEVKTEEGPKKQVIKRRVIKKRKGSKQESTEIVTVEEEGKKPQSTVTIEETELPEEVIKELPVVKPQETTVIEELPEEVTITEVKTKEGPKKQIIKKRVIKKRKGSKEENTEIITVEEEGKLPETTVVINERELSEDEKTTLIKKRMKPKIKPDEQVLITEDNILFVPTLAEKKPSESEDIIDLVKKELLKKALSQPVLDIAQDEENEMKKITKKATKKKKDLPIETPYIEELPEQIQIIEKETVDGKPQKTVIKKRVIKKRTGDKEEITKIVTTEEDGKKSQSVVTIEETELPDEKLHSLPDMSPSETIIEELPEEVNISEVLTQEGPKKTIIKKRVIKKRKGDKQEATEIITLEEEGKEPEISVTVKELDLPKETSVPSEDSVYIEELPEEIKIIEEHTEKGPQKTVIKKKAIRKRKGSKQEATEIVTVEEEGKKPVTTVTVEEIYLPEEYITEIETKKPTEAIIVEELPEEIKITEAISQGGKPRRTTVKTRVLKKRIGDKEEATKIVTVEEEGKRPESTVTIEEVDISDEILKHLLPLESEEPSYIVELPEEVKMVEIIPKEGSPKKQLVKKRIIKKRKGNKEEATEILTVEEEGQFPKTTVTIDEIEIPEELVHELPCVRPSEAKYIEEFPEEIIVKEEFTQEGKPKKTVLKKRIIKKPKGTTDEIIEIVTIEEEGKKPETTVTIEEIDIAEIIPTKPKQKITKKKKLKEKPKLEDTPTEQPTFEQTPKDKRKLRREVSILMPIERKEIKPQKPKIVESKDLSLFADIKLRKPKVSQKQEAKTKLPKFLLKSRIRYIDFPPLSEQETLPRISILEPVYRDNGVLSRNVKEAEKLPKTKRRKLRDKDLKLKDLEKLDLELDELKKKELEKVDDEYKFTKQPRKGSVSDEMPKKLVIGKGKIPQPDEAEENIKLKAVPEKPSEVIDVPKKKQKKEELPDSKKIKIKPTEETNKIDFEPYDIKRDSPEKLDYESVPNDDYETELPGPEKVKVPKKKKIKPAPEAEEITIVKGKPKSETPEDLPDIKLKYKQKPKPEETPENFRLKPFKTEKSFEELDKEPHYDLEQSTIPSTIGENDDFESTPADDENIKGRKKIIKKIKSKGLKSPELPTAESIEEVSYEEVPEVDDVPQQVPEEVQEGLKYEESVGKPDDEIESVEKTIKRKIIKKKKLPKEKLDKPEDLSEKVPTDEPETIKEKRQRKKTFVNGNRTKIPSESERIPAITDLPPVYRDNGILSRNIKEAEKVPKKKRTRLRDIEKDIKDLEKLDVEVEKLKKQELEKVDDEYKYKRQPKEKPEKPEDEVQKMKIGKGKLPEKPDTDEIVKLKKIEVIETVVPEKKKHKKPVVKPFEPYDIDRETPDREKYEPEEHTDEDVKPTDKKEPEKPKKKKKKVEPETLESKIAKGEPKQKEEEEIPDIKLKYKQKELPEDTPEEIKLKPFKKLEENDEQLKKPKEKGSEEPQQKEDEETVPVNEKETELEALEFPITELHEEILQVDDIPHELTEEVEELPKYEKLEEKPFDETESEIKTVKKKIIKRRKLPKEKLDEKPEDIVLENIPTQENEEIEEIFKGKEPLLMKIELISVKPQQVKVTSKEEVVKLAEIKLKKPKLPQKKEAKSKIPKFLLKSRINYIPFPPASENIKEAEKVPKKKRTRLRDIEKDIKDLEKLDVEVEELKKQELEKVDDEYKYKRPPKEKPEKPEDEVQKMKIGKGKLPEKPDTDEIVKLKKIEDIETVVPEKKKHKKPIVKPFEPYDIDRETPEREKYEPEEHTDEDAKPTDEKETEKPKKKKKKVEPETIESKIAKGQPKQKEEEEIPDIKLKYKQKELPEDTPEEIKLKPFKRLEENDEQRAQEETILKHTAIYVGESEQEIPTETPHKIKTKKVKKPKEKTQQKDEEILPVQPEEETLDIEGAEQEKLEFEATEYEKGVEIPETTDEISKDLPSKPFTKPQKEDEVPILETEDTTIEKPEDIKPEQEENNLQKKKIIKKIPKKKQDDLPMKEEERETIEPQSSQEVIPKREPKPVKLPKLKSRITHIDFPPMSEAERKPQISDLEPVVKDNGVISRNIKEAEKVVKAKRKKLKGVDKDFDDLEKLDPDKNKEETVVIRKGKGKIPEKPDDIEEIKLKKVPVKPDDTEVPEEQKPEDKVTEKGTLIYKDTEKDDEFPQFEPVNIIDDTTDKDKYIPTPNEEIETKPIDKEKPKHERKKKRIPKKSDLEKEEDHTFKIPHKDKDDQEPEEITLKPIKKPIPNEEEIKVDEEIPVKPKISKTPGDTEEKKSIKKTPKQRDFPPISEAEITPLVSILEPVYRDNGVLSRNVEEAAKIKPKRKKLKKPDLEKLDKEFEELKKEPEKIDDEYRKKPTRPSKEKPKLMKIIRKTIVFQRAKIVEIIPETINLAEIKLKKPRTTQKQEVESVKIPKFKLKSRIVYVDFPPLSEILQAPQITYIGATKDNAIISRNLKEAEKIIKTKRRKLKDVDKELENLEKLDLEFDEIKKKEPEKVDDVYKYEKKPKEEVEKVDDVTIPIKIGKGKTPKKTEDIEETVQLKKRPEKREEKLPEDVAKEKLIKENVKEAQEVTPKDQSTKNSKKEQPPKEKTKYKPKKKEKPSPESVEITIEKGVPKPTEPEEEKDVKFRIPQNEKPEEEPENITLRPFEKIKDQEGKEIHKTDEPTEPTLKLEIIPKPEDQTEKRKVKKKVPKEKDTDRQKPTEEEIVPQPKNEDVVETFAIKMKKPVAPEKTPDEEITIEIKSTKPTSPEQTDIEEEEFTVKKKKPIPQPDEEVEAEIIVKPEVEETVIEEKVVTKKKKSKKPKPGAEEAEIDVKKEVPETVEKIETEIIEEPSIPDKEKPSDILEKVTPEEEIMDKVTPFEPSVVEEIPIEISVKSDEFEKNIIPEKPVEEKIKEVIIEPAKKKKRGKKVEPEINDKEIEEPKLTPDQAESIEDEEIIREFVIKKKMPRKPEEEEEVEVEAVLPRKLPVSEEVTDIQIDAVIKQKDDIIPEVPQEVEDVNAEFTIMKEEPLKKEVPETEEVVEKVIIRKKKGKKSKSPEKEIDADAAFTIKKEKPVEEEETKYSTEEVIIKVKPVKPVEPVIDEAEAEIIITKEESPGPVIVEIEETDIEEKLPKEQIIGEDLITREKPKEIPKIITEEKPEQEQPKIETDEIKVTIKKPKKKPEVLDKGEAEITIKKIVPVTDEQPEDAAVTEITIKPPLEDKSEEVTIRKPEKKPEISDEGEAKITIEKIVPITDEQPEEVTEITVKSSPEDTSEEVTIQKPKKKTKVPDEEDAEIKIKKIVPVTDEQPEDDKKVTVPPSPEDKSEEVSIKTPNEKPKVSDEEEAEIKIRKFVPITDELPEDDTETTVKPPKEEKSEDVTIKKQKKKPEISDEGEAEITVKKIIPITDEQPEEDTEIRIRPSPEDTSEEVTIQKPKKKSKVPDEGEAEIKIKKFVPVTNEQPEEEDVTVKPQPEDKSEDVTIKKPTKKPEVFDEAEAEVTVKKIVPIIAETPDEETKITIKPAPKDEDAEETFTKHKDIKFPEDEDNVEYTIQKLVPTEDKELKEEVEETVIKRKKPKKPSEPENEISLKEPEKAKDESEEIVIKEKPANETKDADDELTVKRIMPIPGEPEEETDAIFKLKQPVGPESPEDTDVDITFKKEAEPTDDVVEFKVSKKPPSRKPSVEEHSEEITIKKLRPVRKPSQPEVPEYTEVETVTFRPRSTKTKEDVEQEFKISLDSYAEEEISMSTKVKLKKQKPLTYSEETAEDTVKITQEIEEEGPVIEEIIDEGSDAEELPLDDDEISESFHVAFKRKPSRKYSVFEEDEEEISLKKPIENVDYQEQTITLKPRRKESAPTFDQEAVTLSITKEKDIFDDEFEVIHEGDVEKGDVFYSITIYDAEADQAIDLVEGEKVYVIETPNSDWWFVKKHLTDESGWVPAKILMNETQYVKYVQRKLNEKIDKLPVFEKPKSQEKATAPKFIEKLKPIITPDGYTVQFECKVEGFPRPQITWFRQTHIIKTSTDFHMYYDEDNVATLIIHEVFPEDAGTFTCVAKNSAGFASSTTELIVEHPLSSHGSDLTTISRKSLSRTSSLADILEGVPPTFAKKPKTQCVPEETDVVVESTLVGVPEPEIKWYRNGKRISPKGNVTIVSTSETNIYTTILKIKKVEKKQEGKYKIVAKNREGQSSVEFTLKVLTEKKEPPEVLEPLKSVTVRKTETITLSTTIVGNPEPTIEWFKDGKPITRPTPKKVENTYALTIRNANPDDTGEYTVKAKNSLGTAETTAQLTVEVWLNVSEFPEDVEPPLFVKRFEEQNVPEKSPLVLRAKVIGNPIPEVTWLRNNEPLEPSDLVRILYDGENIELSIKETNSELDSGDYKCIAINSAGKASHGAKVSIEVDTVKFTKKLKKLYETSERETLELECETSHSVRTKWWYNETEISGMDHRVVIQDGRTHKLVIKNISQRDEGSYKCTVKNQKTETTVKVQQRKLEFVKRLQDLEITEKDTAILEVEITSDTADVVWYKDGLVLDETNEKFEIEKDRGIRKLLIRTTSIHDEGEYTCTLVDEECKAEVTVIELPPEIITPLQDKTVIKGDKTVFEIELSKGDALARWYKDGKEIQFSEHMQLSIDATLTVQVPTCTFIKPLPEYTVVPINTDAEFLVELSREDVEVTWFRNNKRIEKSSRYTIIKENTFRRLIVHKTTQEDEYEYTCTVEKYQLKTSSKLKIGDKPSPPRGPLEVSGMSDTSFTIQWQPSESDGGSPIIEYIVDMKEATSKKGFKKVGATKGDITDIPINYLDKGHGYKFRITARNSIGISDPYLPEDTVVAGSRIRLHYQFAKTDETLYCLLGIFPPAKLGTKTPPSPPINLKIKDVTSRNATLTWEPPLNNGGTEITGYVVEKKLEFMPKWEKVYTLEAFTLEYTFENLKEKSDYQFRVFAENSVGLTVPSPPTPPLEIRTIGPNAIVIEWGIPESDGGAPLLGYNIAIRDTKKTMWMEIGRVQKGVQKFTIRDLQEDHEYMIRIFAKNEIGLSDPLESDEPFKVLPSGETDQDDFREATDREPTSYSTETSTSWLRDNSMDADIHSYSKGTLLKKDEYFFRIWCYATKLFK